MKIKALVPYAILTTLICQAAPCFCADGDQQEVTPRTLEKAAGWKPILKVEKVLIPELHGCLILSSQEPVREGSKVENIQKVEYGGLADVPAKEALTEKLKPFIGRPVTEKTIEEIKGVIAAHYKANGRPVLYVQIPSQEVTGCLQIVIREAKSDKIIVKGEQYVSKERILHYIHQKPGEEINERQLVKDVDMINRNPFRRVDILFTPGDEKDTTNIELIVADRRPYRFYVGVDDTGVVSTQRTRLFTGVNLGDVFGVDQMLSYQYTCAPSINQFQAHTLQFVTPLPWSHLLSVYGGHSTVEPDLPIKGMRTKGHSEQASGRYTIPFAAIGGINQELTFGFDFKRTNNTVEFAEQGSVFANTVNLFQLSGDYLFKNITGRWATTIEASLYWSPASWLDDMSRAAYTSLRPFAWPRYVYANASIHESVALPYGFTGIAKALGQWANHNLLPSEQLGLGGYSSIRGYDERAINVDNGAILNLELRSPGLPVFSRMDKYKSVNEGLQLLLFADMGAGRNHKLVTGEEKVKYLIGVGPGARYFFSNAITARLDWGVRLHHKAEYGIGHTRVHFSLIGSY